MPSLYAYMLTKELLTQTARLNQYLSVTMWKCLLCSATRDGDAYAFITLDDMRSFGEVSSPKVGNVITSWYTSTDVALT